MASDSHPDSVPPGAGDGRAPEDDQTPSEPPTARTPLWLKLLLPLALLLGIVGGLSFALLRSSPSSTLPAGAREAGSGQGFYGTLALPSHPAPPIYLHNYLGHPVTLNQYRGKAVLVTFLYTNCPDVCPLIASKLKASLDMHGAEARTVQVVAVSVDPRGDTPASVARFLRVHRMTGRMQYLIGSRSRLAATWKAWSVGSTREVDQPQRVAHSALVYGITAGGRIKTIYPDSFEPGEIAHDVPKLAALQR
jgi:protein SCO1/2